MSAAASEPKYKPGSTGIRTRVGGIRTRSDNQLHYGASTHPVEFSTYYEDEIYVAHRETSCSCSPILSLAERQSAMHACIHDGIDEGKETREKERKRASVAASVPTSVLALGMAYNYDPTL